MFKILGRLFGKSNRVSGSIIKNDYTINKLFSGREQEWHEYLKTIKQVMWVYKCVSIIAESIAMLEYSIKDSKNKKVENLGGLAKLFNRPNPYQDSFSFSEGIVYYLLLTGNCYIAKEGLGKNKIDELYLIRPDRMKIDADSNGITNYSYKVNVESPIKYLPEEICHIKFFNPLDEFYGMGKIEAAQLTYEVEYKAAQYNNVFFDNGAKPSGILQTEQTLDENVFKRVKKQFDDEHRGYKKMHKTAVLEQGLKYTQMGLTQKDMDFILQRKLNREEILSIFGVPPAKAGILENANYSNAKEQNYTYQSETITPLAKRISSAITFGIIQVYNPGWYLQYENIIQRDKTEDSNIASRYFSLGAITPNEIREEYLGKEKLPDPMLDVTYLPINVIPAEDAGMIAIPPDNNPPAKYYDCEDHKILQGKKLTPRQVIYRESLLIRKRIGKIAKKIMVKFFNGQEIRIIDRLKSKGQAILNSKGITDDIFNSAFENSELQKFAKRYHTSMLSVTIDVLNDILDLNIDSTTQNPAVNLSLIKLGQKVTRVNDTTKEAIDRIIKQGIENGYTIDQIARGIPEAGYEGIQGVFDSATNYRAETIARTETATAWDSAAINSYKEYGAKFVDVIGCSGTDDYPATNCNRQNIPIADAEGLEFHPNHIGVMVPQI